MKLVGALLTLLIALMVEIVAGYFSVVGLAALFAAAFWPVVVMGGTLEAGKLVAATWLKQNWKNRNVAKLHKFYLLIAIASLMAITSLGIYGYLAKAHLEQEANLPAVEIQIKQMEARIAQADAERVRQESRLTQLDQSVSVLLANSKNAKEARAANLARDAQRRDRLDIQKQIGSLNKEVNGLNESLVPLRLKVSDVSAKLGPVKYVASLFGWRDPNSAVQLIILLIMIAFDPLAVVMVLSGTLSLAEATQEMAARRERRRASKIEDAKMESEKPVPPNSPRGITQDIRVPPRTMPEPTPAMPEPDPLAVMPPRRQRTPLVRYRAPSPSEPPWRAATPIPVPVSIPEPERSLVEPVQPATEPTFSAVTAETIGDAPEANPLEANAALYRAVNEEIERLQPRETEAERAEARRLAGISVFNDFNEQHTKNK